MPEYKTVAMTLTPEIVARLREVQAQRPDRPSISYLVREALIAHFFTPDVQKANHNGHNGDTEQAA